MAPTIRLEPRRATRQHEEDDLDVLAPPKAAPGKVARADAARRERADQPAAPTKVTRFEAGLGMSPPDALRYARWVGSMGEASHIARRATPGNGDIEESGALASAFSFLQASASGHPLPHELMRRLAAELGVDLSQARIHTDPQAAAASAALGARAFTIGRDIFFAAGAYDPDSQDGVELIAHEVAHVAQNVRGGVQSGGRRVSRPEDAHERAADDFAARFRARKAGDPATVVNELREGAPKTKLPFQAELEEHFGTSLDYVETYTGEAARAACHLLSATAFAIKNVVALADPTPQRETLLHELTHVMQAGAARAAGKFDVGSISVGMRGTAVEEEAEHAPAAPVQTAAGDMIHRTTTPTPTAPVDLKKAMDTFANAIKSEIGDLSAAADRGKVQYGVLKGGYLAPRLYKTSKPVDGNRFKQVVSKDQPTVAVTDLKKAYDAHGATAKLAKIKGGADKYVFFADAETAAEVDDATPTTNWNKYKKAVDTLKVGAFTWPVDGPNKGKWTADDAAYTANEDDKYREPMRDAIAKLPRFCSATGNWDAYYTEVVKSSPRILDNRTVGDIFAKIVAESAKAAVDKNFDNVEAGDPIFDAALYGLDAEKEAHGDGVAFDGAKKAIIIEAKAKKSGPSGKEKKQARNYKKIITQQGKGYVLKGENVEKHEFNHLIYTIADASDKALVMKWYQALFVDTADGGPIFTRQQASLIPAPDGVPEFKFKFNPEFTVPLGTKDDPRTHYVIEAPKLGHPGVDIKKLDITVDSSKSQLQSGSVTFDITAGDIEKKNITKTFTPSTIAGVMATADNKIEGLKSSLEKVLGPVTVDAQIVDDGVEATLDIKPGAAKAIAGFQVDGVKLTAKYTTSGNLTVSGKVNFKHKNGKIEGQVDIGWSNSWTFSGQLTVKEGMIPGVSQFTATVDYADGNAVIGVDQISIEKKIGAVTLTGTGRRLNYDTKKGAFAGELGLQADLGVFGHASADATIEDNALKNCTFNYDSPEFKYPAKSDKPAFKGTIGGTLTYNNGQFSGAVRGTAGLNVPALQAIAGDSGLGLALDGHIHPDGHFSGTIGTTTPLKLGKYFEIPSVACTIKDDGSVEGDFKLKVVNFKYLEKVEIGCKVDKSGVTISEAAVKVAFGSEKDKVHGSLDVSYSQAGGLAITGQLSVKIKEGMVATGTLTYNSKTNAITVALTVDEITLLKHGPVTKSLFKFAKQIPLVSVYGLGVYLDIGFNLDFNYEFDLRLKPTITLEDLSMETFEYKQVKAEIELLGQLAARLVATPKVGLGLFALSPSLLRGGGGIMIPITGEALLKPKGKLTVLYAPGGGASGDVELGMALTFGIKGSVNPYANISLLDGVWEKEWKGDSLADFEIMPPKELFNFQLNLGGDLKKQDPQIPDAPGAPKGGGGKQLPQEAPKTQQAGSATGDKNAQVPSSGPSGEGGGMPDDPVKLSSMTSGLKNLPGYKTIEAIMKKAGAAWEKIKGFFGRVAKAFKSFFEGMQDAMEEIINGFANEGLAYLPKLVKKIVGATAWEVIEPLITAVASNADKMLSLFETDPPTGVKDFFPWALKIAAKAWGLAFDSIGSLVSAIRTMISRLGGVATKLVTKMVQDGMIGVKRHTYWYWLFGKHYFLAATQYKIHLMGTSIDFYDQGMITDPRSVVGFALFEVLEQMGVPSTGGYTDEHTGENSRDRWA
jgi:Domain of unknown function (DUF4157)